MTDLLFGTSGWSYDEWVGPFYERKQGMFTQYTKCFRTAEVDSTFYRFPTSSMVKGWYRSSPQNFTFSLKLPQTITHEKRLRVEEGAAEELDRFLELVRPLAEKTGAILIQLRPNFTFKKDFDSLKGFVGILPKNYDFAVEFRHPSWLREETYSVLRDARLAYTIVDEPLLPPETHLTADFAYVRWHGRGASPWYNYDYGKDELRAWVPKVEETAGKTKRVYGYFNNHFYANAVKNCIEMLELLNMASEEQRIVREKLLSYRRGEAKEEAFPEGLERFLKPCVEPEQEELSVGDLLMKFMGSTRLLRAEQIEDRQIEILRESRDSIEARIKEYSLEVDLKNRILKHNCEDWFKGAGMKRICKHIGKLFLILPEKKAQEILKDMWEEKDKWKFETS